jgi:hypothetical protein
MILTPFEQAEKNRTIHTKRMQLTHKVTDLVMRLKEAEAFLEAANTQKNNDLECPLDYGMYDPNILETVRQEVKSITATLVIMAGVWESVAGVSA